MSRGTNAVLILIGILVLVSLVSNAEGPHPRLQRLVLVAFFGGFIIAILTGAIR
jgi:hypothetical protein